MVHSIVYLESVEKILRDAGFSVGGVVLNRGVLRREPMAYWFRGLDVIRVHYDRTFVDRVVCCTVSAEVASSPRGALSQREKNFVSVLSSSTADVLEAVKAMCEIKAAEVPTLDILFGDDAVYTSYASIGEKVSALRDVMEQCESSFIDTFRDEYTSLMESLQPVGSEVSVYDVYMDGGGDLYYVAGKVGALVVLSPVADGLLNRNIMCSYSVLENKYMAACVPDSLDKLLARTLSMCREFLSPAMLVENLKVLGYDCDFTPLENVSYKDYDENEPISVASFDRISGNKYGIREDIYGVSIILDLDASVCLKVTTQLPCIDVLSMLDDVKPYRYVNTAAELISAILREFSFVLCKKPDVQESLYQTLLFLEKLPALEGLRPDPFADSAESEGEVTWESLREERLQKMEAF